jgi:hypothetical protein
MERKLENDVPTTADDLSMIKLPSAGFAMKSRNRKKIGVEKHPGNDATD